MAIHGHEAKLRAQKGPASLPSRRPYHAFCRNILSSARLSAARIHHCVDSARMELISSSWLAWSCRMRNPSRVDWLLMSSEGGEGMKGQTCQFRTSSYCDRAVFCAKTYDEPVAAGIGGAL